MSVSIEGPVVAQPIPELIIAHPIDGQFIDPKISEQQIRLGVRWSRRLSARATSEVLLVRARATLIRRRIDANRAKMRNELVV